MSAALQSVSFGSGFALEPGRGAQLRGTQNLRNLSIPARGGPPLMNISYLFEGSGYSGPLADWNTSSVLLASHAFLGLKPGVSINISTWNLSGLRAADGCRLCRQQRHVAEQLESADGRLQFYVNPLLLSN
eukprot:g26656.t1